MAWVLAPDMGEDKLSRDQSCRCPGFEINRGLRYKVSGAFLFSPSAKGPGPGITMSHFFPTAAETSQHAIFPGVTIATCAAERMMLSLVTIQPQAVVEEHSHPHEQVGMVIEGQAIFYIGGEQKTLGPGDMYRIPGNVRHRVIALDRPVKALDIFHPIREDYR